MTKTPTRRCAACRRRDEKVRMLRFTCGEAGPAFDREKRAPGRGMYVHPAVPCWSRLGDPRLWEWALKAERSVLTKERLHAAMEQARSELGEGDAPAPKAPGRKIRM